jgi:hypothetical protein
MFEIILIGMASYGWLAQIQSDMFSRKPTAIAIVQEGGARIGMFCNSDTNYETAIVIQRTERTDLPRIGSTFVTYRFDSNREISGHWQNGNSDSVSINSGIEKRAFLANLKTAKQLRFRARTDNLASVDMIFDLTLNREKLDDFFKVCQK